MFGKLEMEGLSWALGGVSPVDVTPDTPFLRSIVDEAPTLRRLMSCSLTGVRQARGGAARHRCERARADA